MTADATPMQRWVLPVPVSADEDGVALGVQESAGGELANLPFVDWRIGEHELVEILEDGNLAPPDTIANRARLTVCVLGSIRLAMRGKISSRRASPLPAISSEAGAHAIELEPAHGLEDLMAFHQATFLMLS